MAIFRHNFSLPPAVKPGISFAERVKYSVREVQLVGADAFDCIMLDGLKEQGFEACYRVAQKHNPVRESERLGFSVNTTIFRH
ncbi:hypothetical protein BIU82_08315 [Arthrobacter sp. SW1]|nr:hypothetical protein BIU82_08315 [Arthrobacter sp. SW1]